MGYHHTQTGYLHYILYGVTAIVLSLAWLTRDETAVPLLLAGIAALTLLAAESFRYLTVQDEVDCLALRYGPLPFFHKRIRYTDVTAVERGHSSILDGWGIHYVPGRGWTYNLWGFDCVKVSLGRKVIRVGTDDVENLVEFLRTKIP